MAIFHLCAQVISRTGGRSSVSAAAYRSGIELVDQRTGENHDFTTKDGVLWSGILAPADAPAWVLDRSRLWNSVELRERRCDAQLAREFILALPSELDDNRRRELVTSFVRDVFVSRGMVADVAIHRPSGRNDGRNEHAHVMLTLRRLQGDGWGNKERAWNDRALLRHWRESWAIAQNQALARAGVDAHVDHRSLVEQGSVLVPTIHEGWGPAAASRRARNEEIRRANNEILAAEFELTEAMAEVEAAQLVADELIERARIDAALRPAPTGQRGLQHRERRLDGAPIGSWSGGASGSGREGGGGTEVAARAARPSPSPAPDPAVELAVAQLRAFISAATTQQSALDQRINDLRRQHKAAGERIKAAKSAVRDADRMVTALRQVWWLPRADDVARAQRKLRSVDQMAGSVRASLARASDELGRLGIFSFLRRRALENEVASLRAAANKLAKDRPALAAAAVAPLTYEDAQADLQAQASRLAAARKQEAEATVEASTVAGQLTQASERFAELIRKINDATARLDELVLAPNAHQARMDQGAQDKAGEVAEPEVVPDHLQERPPGG